MWTHWERSSGYSNGRRRFLSFPSDVYDVHEFSCRFSSTNSLLALMHEYIQCRKMYTYTKHWKCNGIYVYIKLLSVSFAAITVYTKLYVCPLSLSLFFSCRLCSLYDFLQLFAYNITIVGSVQYLVKVPGHALCIIKFTSIFNYYGDRENHIMCVRPSIFVCTVQ